MYMALPEGIEDNNQGTRMYMYSENGIGNFEFTDTTNKIETLDWESTFSGADRFGFNCIIICKVEVV